MTEVVCYLKREYCLKETCHLETRKVTASNVICLMAFPPLAKFVTVAFILNINNIYTWLYRSRVPILLRVFLTGRKILQVLYRRVNYGETQLLCAKEI